MWKPHCLYQGASQRVIEIMRKHPRIVPYAVGTVATAVAIQQYMKFATTSLQKRVYKQMLRGTRPPVPVGAEWIPREEISKELVDLFFPKGGELRRTFGLIVGPTGTGKTVLVSDLCNQYPEGVLFYEVREPKTFASGLARAVSMKISPSNVIDLVLGYFSASYFMYYRLSNETQEESMDIIFETLEAAATKFISVKGATPTLFIDGSDLLAKHERKLFEHLVSHAKRIANDGVLCVVLVSSEGSILPLIQELSAASRCAKVFEVTDIDDERATDYLFKQGISKGISKEFIKYTGGRFVYLVKIKQLYQMYRRVYPEMSDEWIYKNTMSDVFLRKINRQRLILDLQGQVGKAIIQSISSSKDGQFLATELIKKLGSQSPEDRERLMNSISTLVSQNVLRYTATGSLSWHGRPQQHEFKKLNNII